MKEFITRADYEQALRRVSLYEEQQKCQHINVEHVVEYNSYPYGRDYEYDRCLDCGKMINLIDVTAGVFPKYHQNKTKK